MNNLAMVALFTESYLHGKCRRLPTDSVVVFCRAVQMRRHQEQSAVVADAQLENLVFVGCRLRRGDRRRQHGHHHGTRLETHRSHFGFKRDVVQRDDLYFAAARLQVDALRPVQLQRPRRRLQPEEKDKVKALEADIFWVTGRSKFSKLKVKIMIEAKKV